MLFAHDLVEVFTRDVSLSLEKGGENQLTLFRVLEMILFQIGTEGLHLDFVRHDGTISLSHQIPAGDLFEELFGARGEIVIEILR